MALRTPLILNQTTGRIEELAAGDTIFGNYIEGLLGKNLLINGDMGVFQRGSLANRPNGESYTVDRWSFASLGTGTSNWGVGTFTVSDSSPILPVPSPPRFWLGLNIVAGTDTAWLRQKIEKVAVYHNGKATLSFWMRSGVAGKKVGVRIIQDFGGGTGASAAVFLEGTVSRSPLRSRSTPTRSTCHLLTARRLALRLLAMTACRYFLISPQQPGTAASWPAKLVFSR